MFPLSYTHSHTRTETHAHLSPSPSFSFGHIHSHTRTYRHIYSHSSFRHIPGCFLSHTNTILKHLYKQKLCITSLYTTDITLQKVEGYCISQSKYFKYEILVHKSPSGIWGYSSPCSPSFPFCSPLFTVLLTSLNSQSYPGKNCLAIDLFLGLLLPGSSLLFMVVLGSRNFNYIHI